MCQLVHVAWIPVCAQLLLHCDASAQACDRQVPFFFKWAIDGMTAKPSGATPVAAATAIVVLTPPAMLIMYGVARASAAFCNELRNAVFAKG